MQKAKLKWWRRSLAALALALPALLFHYGFSPYHCDHDVCTNNRALWGHHAEIDRKIVALRNPRTDQPVLQNGKPIMVTSVREGVIGVVIRDGIPTAIGWLGGVFAPILLFAIAGIIGVGTAKPAN